MVSSDFCPDVDGVWKGMGFVEFESGGLLVREHLPLLLLRSDAVACLGASVAVMP